MKLFAALREQAGTRERELELADGARVGRRLARARARRGAAGLVYAVNRAYVDRERAARRRRRGRASSRPSPGGDFRLSEAPLSLERVAAEVASDDAGAIATFVGTTRSRSRGRDVVRLEYEAYEGMAEAEMERIATELRERHDVVDVAIHHRVGPVEIGETSVVIAVSARPPRRGARGVPRGDRHAQADRAALEEGAVRRRRGMDRPGFLTASRTLEGTTSR